MAMVGRKPNPDRSQVRNRAEVAEWTEVPNVPFAGAPKLPARHVLLSSPERSGVEVDQWTDPSAWPANTKRWYRAISRMPHAVLWSDADWEQVFMSAEVHARTVEGWKGYGGPEIRAREKMHGVNADNRRDLRIRYVDAIEPARVGRPGTVSNLDDFRSL